MSQDSIFNVQPGGEPAEQPNPFAVVDEGQSPFQSVQADATPFGAVHEDAKLPEIRATETLAPVTDNPFQVVNSNEAPQVDDRSVDVDPGQPFAMTGLGVGSSNGAKREEVELDHKNGFAPPSPSNGGNPFAPVEAPVPDHQERSNSFVSPDPVLRPVDEPAIPVQESGGFQFPQDNGSEQMQQSAGRSGEGFSGVASATAASATQLDPNQQLELRAIFGVNHILSREEILQLICSLPGIRNVGMIDPASAQAFESLKNTVAQLGFTDKQGMGLSCSSGVIDFISEGSETLAVLHEGQYAGGVKERLIIACRELSKMS